MININPSEKWIELGGGSNPVLHPNVDVRPCFDANGNPTVDFTADFDEPLPIQSDEWDGVFSRFVIEHISWRKVRSFISEVFRVLKSGGRFVFITANTQAQLKYIENHSEGWDGRDPYTSFSCILFGDQDYPENTHKNYMSPSTITDLLSKVGFEKILIQPFGNISTDMIVEAYKPNIKTIKTDTGTILLHAISGTIPDTSFAQESVKNDNKMTAGTGTMIFSPSSLFDKQYFDGGKNGGGYAGQGYWDFPCHEITARHILARNPSSVFELGCARGYILKRIQDKGIPTLGVDISKHCYLTRVCESVKCYDICQEELHGIEGKDLCYSVATLEHIPEQYLPKLIKEMSKAKRGLHGIDFGSKNDGSDKTKCTLKLKEWWLEQFNKYAPGWPVEIVDKEELESGNFPDDVLKGDGKVKLNIGSFTTMFYNGWINIDIHDLANFASAYRFKFQKQDIRQGLPYGTSSVDLIYSCHSLEHITYDEGLKFLRDCRRIIKPDGVMRIIVPNLSILNGRYIDGSLGEFDEVNTECANCPTQAGKFWNLVHNGHQAAYDEDSLSYLLKSAGFTPYRCFPFQTMVGSDNSKQILRETLDMLPCLSLYMEATPKEN